MKAAPATINNMNTKRYFLITAITIALIFGVFVSTAAAEGPTGSGEKIISLSNSGTEIANTVAYSPDGGSIAVGTTSGLFIFDAQTLDQKVFVPTGVWVRDVNYSPDGSTMAVALFDSTAGIWDAETGKVISTFADHEGWVRTAIFTPDGDQLVTIADDDTLRVWSVSDGELALTISGLTGARIFAISPDGQMIAVGLQDKTIKLIDFNNGNVIRILEGHRDWVRSLAFSPDGLTLASGAFDSDAILWDVPTGKMKYLLPDHQSSVLDVVFSPDGSTLASGSVDSTVMLWNVETGKLERTLVGHEDFVYGVDYSPDGNTIISGSQDNTVRVWDITDADVGNLPASATPSDCRICHHPAGLNAEPRVIQITCEACHANGATVNFCPLFPRDPKVTSAAISYLNSGIPVGLPIASQNLSVLINYPTNGEYLYSSYATRAPVLVTGQVNTPENAADVLVRLEVYSGDSQEPSVTIETHPSAEGRYVFKLMMNPPGALSANLKPLGVDCKECHEDFIKQGDIPNGMVHLKVSAINADNETATDERWLRMDTSTITPITVQVIDNDTEQPIVGVPVNASTILYEWRARYARQLTDANGFATLNVETLDQASTTYQLIVPDTAINGYYYSTIEPLTITFNNSDDPSTPHTIRVHVKKSKISGQINGLSSNESVDVFAIHIPDGSLTKTTSEGDLFEFNELPEGEYQLIVDPKRSREIGLKTTPVYVDISKNPEANVKLELTPIRGQVFQGQLSDEEGNNLPFGWVTTPLEEVILPDPTTGQFIGVIPDSSEKYITLSVPGYYSQRAALNAMDGTVTNYTFIEKTETKILDWGKGTIVLPSDSVYTSGPEGIHLTRGWIWGNNDNAELIKIQVANKWIEISSGKFAIQYLPPSQGYLYLSAGQAIIRENTLSETIIKTGEMVTFSSDQVSQPVAFNETANTVLRQSEVLQNPIVWESSLTARVQNWFIGIGIGSIQIITFVTYTVVIAVLVGFALRGLYWLWKKR